MIKLFFIGTGKMATAIAAGLTAAGVYNPDELCGYDISPDAAGAFNEASGVRAVSAMPLELLEATPAVLIAVKPQMVKAALAEYDGLLRDKTVISIAAGVPIELLEELTGSKRIIRVMPNTPALVGCGATAFAPSKGAEASDIALADKIFSSIGIALQMPESSLDAVTALSGSGPAYVFEFIQALADGGVAEGLSRKDALLLAAQTVAGAAKMVLETGEHPAELKDKVTSPAGTTSRALEVMAERAFTGTVIQAVRAAAARSKELGKK